MAGERTGYLRFWWACVKDAWEGSLNLANAWSGLWGPFLLWLVFYWRGQSLRLPDQLDSYALLLGLSLLGATWIGVFAVRLAGAPARLYAKLHRTIPMAPTSDIAINVSNKFAYYHGMLDAAGHELPTAKVFIVRVVNTGARYLQKCQLIFGNHPATGYFDLRPGEPKDLPLLWMNINAADPRPLVYFIDSESGKILDGSGWLPHAGTYEIKVFSADTYPASLAVELSTSTETPPRQWALRAANATKGPQA
jgi:hypothetical protein